VVYENDFYNIHILVTCHTMFGRIILYCTSGSAMAQGPRDALVSRNSATYKTSHLKPIVWHYLQTDGQTHDDAIYRG